MDTIPNVEYLDSDTDGSRPLYTDSVSDTVRKYPYRFHPLRAGLWVRLFGPGACE
jgi:hypothetical protein